MTRAMHSNSLVQVVTLLLPLQTEKCDASPSSISSTYKQIIRIVKLPAVLRLALLLMLCKVRPPCACC